jgi:hypothetical protein
MNPDLYLVFQRNEIADQMQQDLMKDLPADGH